MIVADGYLQRYTCQVTPELCVWFYDPLCVEVTSRAPADVSKDTNFIIKQMKSADAVSYIFTSTISEDCLLHKQSCTCVCWSLLPASRFLIYFYLLLLFIRLDFEFCAQPD